MLRVKVVSNRDEVIAAINAAGYHIVALEGVIPTESNPHYFCSVFVPEGHTFEVLRRTTKWHLKEKRHEKGLPTGYRKFVARGLTWSETEKTLRQVFGGLHVELPLA